MSPRFPSDTEPSFWEEYVRGGLPGIRLALALIGVVVLLVGARTTLYLSGGLGLPIAFGMVGLLGVVGWMTFAPWYPRVNSLIVSALTVTLAVVMVVGASAMPSTRVATSTLFGAVVASLVLMVLLRPGMVAGSAAALLTLIIPLVAAAMSGVFDPSELQLHGTNAAIGVVVAIAAGYLAERSARREHRQRLLLEAARVEMARGMENERVLLSMLQQRVDAYRAFVERVAAGDLTGRLDVEGDDALARLGHHLNAMNDALRSLATEMRDSVANLSGAAERILAAVAQQAGGASEQSAAINQTTATVAEVRASAEQAAQLATVVSDTAQQASRAAESGVGVASDATSGMSEIRQRVQSIAENILALSEQSQQIGEIITTVSDLADQSNLLSLNAAIEASRAGEQGKGFAVVATEIRTLAEQSKQATAQVRTILSDIQRATNATVLATEQGSKGVDSGVHLIDQTRRTIDELSEASQRTEQVAQQIAAAVRQHTVGMEQIAAAMENLGRVTGQQRAATTNTQQAAQNLAELASRLRAASARYQL